MMVGVRRSVFPAIAFLMVESTWAQFVAGFDTYTGVSSTTDFSFLQNSQPKSGHGSHVAGIIAARLDGDVTRPSNML